LYADIDLLDRKDANTARPLEGLKIIDVGCGGGLVCEVLKLLERARLCCFFLFNIDL
jgi:2-polyprenyl-3-methyl-5-hydroxy-6-metoxy-1,4-benzoquinol methylase